VTLDRLDPKTSALVLIDLQQGIVDLVKDPADAASVLQHSAALIARFHTLGACVVRVRVGWSEDLADILRQPVDLPASSAAGGLPANWLDWPADLSPQAHDVLIIKRQWGAFYGTDLDLQLRRRGIQTVVLGGISTHAGVESTARSAWELGYSLILAEDAMCAMQRELHEFSIRNIMPRIGRVRRSAEILAALPAAK